MSASRSLQVSALAVAVASLLPFYAAAQQAPSDDGIARLDAVKVTVERRSEDSKDVPVSASVLRPEFLDAISTSGSDIRVLAGKAPSLNIESSNGRVFPRVYIRGYGNTDFNTYASQPVSLVYDDVVQENAFLKGFPIFDLEGLEVLRGPQGTLFGRNTPAGVVKFNSVKPTIGANDGYASLSYGTYGTMTLESGLSIAMGEHWAARLSTLGQRRDDWVENRDGRDLEGYTDSPCACSCCTRAATRSVRCSTRTPATWTAPRVCFAPTSSSPAPTSWWMASTRSVPPSMAPTTRNCRPTAAAPI